ncbi:MAG: hypothetical protein LAN70_13910 [Acidobacteriia bacterium]|nr:hypothetical protein [Terriglobia bacterium]
MSKVHIASSTAGYTHSLRVTISLASGTVKVLKAMRVAMRAVAPPPSPPTEDSSGYWFEIRDKNGKLLYYRPLPHGDPESIEVFDDQKRGTIRRIPATKPERKIELIVPDFPDAAEFTLHGPKIRADRTKPSAVLNRLPMEHLRGLAQGKAATDGGPSHERGGAR